MLRHYNGGCEFEDGVEMVGHYRELMQSNLGEVLWDSEPCFVDDCPSGKRSVFPLAIFPKMYFL